MKRRKLIISLLTSAVVLAAAAGLSGCGGSNSAPTTAAESTEAATAAESTETATETEESTEAETTEPETESVDSSEEETANEDAVDPAAVREYWNGNWFDWKDFLASNAGDSPVDNFSIKVYGVAVQPASEYLPGDLNHDGEVNAKDVTILRRYVAGGYGVTLS